MFAIGMALASLGDVVIKNLHENILHGLPDSDPPPFHLSVTSMTVQLMKQEKQTQPCYE